MFLCQELILIDLIFSFSASNDTIESFKVGAAQN